MQKAIKPLLVVAVLLSTYTMKAQNVTSAVSPLGKNIFNVNLSSLLFKNGSVQFERVLSPNTSFAIGVSYMPKTGLPFADALKEQYGTNADAKRAIETTELSSFTITPEFRFYLSGKAPQGFYIAPFLLYQKMNFQQVYQFTASSGREHFPLIGGDINNFGGGVLLGSQWALGNHFTFDWWIAGPSVGTTSGLLSGTDDMSDMNATDRANLESDIEDTKLPLLKIDATVGNNKVDAKLSGGYVGLRAMGITFGYRF
jgi:hypothetical protein